MDTAFIDDSHLLPANLKGHFGIKLCNYGATSSTGSMTSVSSTTTPRAGHFDSFWLEHNNPSESEDIQQVSNFCDGSLFSEHPVFYTGTFPLLIAVKSK